MKTLIFLTVLVALVCGYWYFVYRPIETNVVVPVEITEPEKTVLPTAPTSQLTSSFSNEEFGFSFDYRTEPFGYTIFENTAAQNVEQNMLFGVTLVRSDDYNESVKAAAEGNAHDGPPMINILIFDAPNVTDVPVWLTQNKLVTNCEPGTVLATVLAGKDAFSCLWDGLYLGVTVAILHNDMLYLLTGTREAGENVAGFSYRKDFDELMASFVLR